MWPAMRSIGCAAACKLIFFVLYSTAITAGIVEGYAWVSEASGIGDTYLRSLAFTFGMFLTLTAIPIAMKWLVIGRWTEERIPVWSLGYFRFWLVRRMIQVEPDDHVHRYAALQRVPPPAGGEDRHGTSSSSPASFPPARICCPSATGRSSERTAIWSDTGRAPGSSRPERSRSAGTPSSERRRFSTSEPASATALNWVTHRRSTRGRPFPPASGITAHPRGRRPTTT